MKTITIMAIIATLAVFCMASKCSIGDKTLPQKSAPASQVME